MTLLNDFENIFQGLESAFGRFEVETGSGSGKKAGKAEVLKRPRTDQDWKNHLEGLGWGIGIVPINAENKCLWGAIDVDVYPLDLNALAKEIDDHDLPLIVCRSKSGGAHLYVFLRDWTPAVELIAFLKDAASVLGYSKSEIFPKQKEILVERGDVGNWLNLPYYNGDQSVRYALKNNPEDSNPIRLDLSEFIEYVDEKRIDIGNVTVNTKKRKAGEVEKGPFAHGPPCLIALATAGVPDGARNNALFSMGVYLRQAKKDTWKTEIVKYNEEHMDPPLPNSEVGVIIGTLDRKDYGYRCDDEPIVSFCNKDVCFTRKYGVGTANYRMDVGNLPKVESEPPIWIMDVDGRPVELATDDLHQRQRFIKSCMEQLNVLPPPMKAEVWMRQVGVLLQQMVETEGAVIPASVSATVRGRFEDVFARFLDQAKETEDFDGLESRPLYSVEDNRVYFTLQCLSSYANAPRDYEWTDRILNNELRRLGAVPGVIQTHRPVSVLAVPRPDKAGRAKPKFEPATEMPF